MFSVHKLNTEEIEECTFEHKVNYRMKTEAEKKELLEGDSLESEAYQQSLKLIDEAIETESQPKMVKIL